MPAELGDVAGGFAELVTAEAEEAAAVVEVPEAA
jgi:hypothetical protein